MITIVLSSVVNIDGNIPISVIFLEFWEDDGEIRTDGDERALFLLFDLP